MSCDDKSCTTDESFSIGEPCGARDLSVYSLRGCPGPVSWAVPSVVQFLSVVSLSSVVASCAALMGWRRIAVVSCAALAGKSCQLDNSRQLDSLVGAQVSSDVPFSSVVQFVSAVKVLSDLQLSSAVRFSSVVKAPSVVLLPSVVEVSSVGFDVLFFNCRWICLWQQACLFCVKCVWLEFFLCGCNRSVSNSWQC